MGRVPGFLSHGGTPSYHPFIDGIFHKPASDKGDLPCMDPIMG